MHNDMHVDTYYVFFYIKKFQNEEKAFNLTL